MAAGGVIGALRVVLGIDTAAFEEGLSGVRRSMANVGRNMRQAGSVLTAGVSAPLAALGAVTLKTAGDFEASLNRVQAASSATADEMTKLRKLAMDLGSSTSKSASEAANAIEMLAKNGLTTTQILGGAAKASLMLSEATGGELSDAADVATNVMAQFKIEAQDMGKVVDGITGVTLSSQFGFEDYTLALGQAGGVAAAVGVEFEDFNAGLAATSSVFSSGSDAGTSFKNFLTRLVPASDNAAAAMDELGLQFFEADGSMKSMAAVAEELKTKMGGLSEEALNTKMTDIFGLDGMRTGIALMDQGAAGVEKFSATIAKASATDQAAARLKGFNGELEKLRGALETLQIAIASSGVLEFMTGLVQKLAELTSALGETNPAVLKWGTVIAGVGVALGPVLVSLGLLVTAVAAIGAPVWAAVAAIAATTAGIMALWEGLKIIFPSLNEFKIPWGEIKAAIIAAKDAVVEFAAIVLEKVTNIKATFADLKQSVVGEMQAMGEGIKAAVDDPLKVIGDTFEDQKNKTIADAKMLYDVLVGHSIIPDLVTEIGAWMGRLPAAMGDPAAEAADTVEGSFSGMEDIGRTISQSLSGSFKGLIDGTRTFKDAIGDLLGSLADMWMDKAFQAIFGGGMGGGGGLFGSLLGGLGGLVGFKNGGSFNVGGAGGVDSQLVAFRASPDETVSITKPGQERQSGGEMRLHVAPSKYFDVHVESISRKEASVVTQAGIGQFSKSLPGQLPGMMTKGQARNG